MKRAATLESWLDTATKGFFPVTQERLRREYTAAYHDALEAGEPNILTTWGDPKRVNRELRRTYLTVRDTKMLQPVLPWGPEPEFPQPEPFLGRLWHVILLVSAILFVLRMIPWPVPMDTAARWILTGSGIMFALLALDSRRLWWKAKRTFHR